MRSPRTGSPLASRLLVPGLLALLVACHAETRPPPPAPTPASAAERAKTAGGSLGPGDVVEVRVFQEPEHSGTWRVSPEGTIDYPLCGKVPLSGRTASSAADVLRDCLTRYLRRPQVAVLVREYNSQKIFVFGEVQKPGTFPVDGEVSIIQAITLAGGFTKLAAKNNTLVTRVVDGQERKIRVPVEDIGVGRERNFLLQAGDIVFVPESFF
ncbi:polysaccharide export protein [Corallococcus sp. bb12-1]|uniref:polysaccharide biosynthesis/export family protein n=1 Tax=Corallococcus sp. bb12-1 TaxID=2996784 RepID=UPI00226DD632|nr:polysaccharide biosynthesis/export family protein [Corallococcus sp. bb12-1]MCY1045008.1 polysaccharide export protein [Corallococcus sp. bb12-1]